MSQKYFSTSVVSVFLSSCPSAAWSSLFSSLQTAFLSGPETALLPVRFRSSSSNAFVMKLFRLRCSVRQRLTVTLTSHPIDLLCSIARSLFWQVWSYRAYEGRQMSRLHDELTRTYKVCYEAFSAQDRGFPATNASIVFRGVDRDGLTVWMIFSFGLNSKSAGSKPR